MAGDDDAARERAIAAVTSRVDAFATPVLLTLRAHLALREKPADIRAYWPKGQVATAALSADRRTVLSRVVIAPVVGAIDAELLRRFGNRQKFHECVIDEELKRTVVPFNERTASARSVALPRGSRVKVEAGKLVRLFLNWCEPPRGVGTDLDLSVAFFDQSWQYAGVCSYYQLTLDKPGI